MNDRYSLKPFSLEEVELYFQWTQSNEIMSDQVGKQPVALSELVQEFKETAGWQSPAMMRWWIMDCQGTHAGYIHAWKFDKFENHYEFGRVIHPNFRGKGLGSLSLRLILDQIFKNTSAHRAQALTAVTNQANLKCWEKLGITIEGRLRSYISINGVHVDCFLGSILRDEWQNGFDQ